MGDVAYNQAKGSNPSVASAMSIIRLRRPVALSARLYA